MDVTNAESRVGGIALEFQMPLPQMSLIALLHDPGTALDAALHSLCRYKCVTMRIARDELDFLN